MRKSQWDFQGLGTSGEGYKQPIFWGGREAGTEFALYVLEVKGDTFTFAATEAGKMTARVDPTRTPKTIDLTDPKGRTWLGVYELKGDKLVIEDKVPSGQAYAIYKQASK